MLIKNCLPSNSVAIVADLHPTGRETIKQLSEKHQQHKKRGQPAGLRASWSLESLLIVISGDAVCHFLVDVVLPVQTSSSAQLCWRWFRYLLPGGSAAALPVQAEEDRQP